MKGSHWLGVFVVATSVACGGGQKTDDVGGEATETPAGPVVECRDAATEARTLIESSGTVAPATPAEFNAFYTSWRTSVAAWNADDHVCLQEGPDVMTRLSTHKEVAREFETADEALQTRLAPEFVARPNATAYFDTFFAAGVKPAPKVRESAFNVARAGHDASFKAFKEHGWGNLDADGTTTCVTSSDPFDPKGDVRPQMLQIFEGKTDVHVLCRLPVAASTFAGDEAGALKLELHTGDFSDEPVTAVDLGKPEKWGKTQFFTARFAVPLQSTRDAETYHVHLVARRPTMGDEEIVNTTFWWHR